MSLLNLTDSMDSMKPRVDRGDSIGASARLGTMLALHQKSALSDISQTVTDKPSVGSDHPAIEPSTAFRRLQHQHRVAIVLAELIEGIRFEARSDRSEATLLVLDSSDKFVPLITIRRPKFDIFLDELDVLMGLAPARQKNFAQILEQEYSLDSFWAMLAPVDTDRSPATMELLAVTAKLASTVVQRFKYAFCCRRPYELSYDIQPMIATPAHYSFPSGHATQAFAIARMIAASMSSRSGLVKHALIPLAADIAKNREVAGVHFPVDSVAGRLLGEVIAIYLLGRGGGDVKPLHATFEAATAAQKVHDLDVAQSTAGSSEISLATVDRTSALLALLREVQAEHN